MQEVPGGTPPLGRKGAGGKTSRQTFISVIFRCMYMVNITSLFTVASIVIFIVALFVIMLYERERSKERKHAER